MLITLLMKKIAYNNNKYFDRNNANESCANYYIQS